MVTSKLHYKTDKCADKKNYVGLEFWLAVVIYASLKDQWYRPNGKNRNPYAIYEDWMFFFAVEFANQMFGGFLLCWCLLREM